MKENRILQVQVQILKVLWLMTGSTGCRSEVCHCDATKTAAVDTSKRDLVQRQIEQFKHYDVTCPYNSQICATSVYDVTAAEAVLCSIIFYP